MNGGRLWGYIQNRLRMIRRDENLYLRFFALFLAIILWFFAGGEGRFGMAERVVTVPVEFTNLPRDLTVAAQLEPVRVRLRGLTPLVGTAERQTVARVNLAGAIEGEGTYGVTVSVPTGVEVVSITPRWVRLITERILEEEMAITVALIGLPPHHGIASLSPDPPTVTARAARSVLATLFQVVAYVSLSEPATRLEGIFPLRAIDQRGRTLDDVTLSPPEVTVVLEQVNEDTQ